MRFSVAPVSRAMLVAFPFIVAALVVVPRSGAAGNGFPLTTPTTDPTICPSYTSAQLSYCYEIVTYTSGSNYVNGINDAGVIDGAYSNGSVYGSFAATPVATPNMTLNPYTNFTSESDGSRNTYLYGLDNGTGKNFNSEFMPGYAAGAGGRPQGVVLLGSSGQWSGLIHDPNQANSGPCAITEFLAINDSRMGVGFYDTGSTSPCIQHAFEFYSNVSLSPPYTFVDLTPTDPFGCTQSATSSEATGISTLGDVVGYVTCTSGSSPRTASWIYRQLKYTAFCYTKNSTATSCGANAFSTYANGINFSDVVVGDYTDNSNNQHGFIINPTPNGSSFVHVDIPGKDDTVLRSVMEATEGMSQNTYWTGSTTGDDGVAKGIVGMCMLPRHCL